MTTLLIILGIIVLLAAILLINAAAKKPGERARPAPDVDVDGERAAQNLSAAIRFKTVSDYDLDKVDQTQFDGLISLLEERYPNVHRVLTREITTTKCLIFRWRGRDDGLKPVGFMAHMDVVPVEEDTLSEWTHPPFDGVIADGYVWGRGALDMKGQLIAVLESVERLISEGFTPKRDVYLLFGSDEEVMGVRGASLTSRILEERGLKFEYILDEGGAVIDGNMLSIPREVAVIGVCEKGYMDVKITVKSPGGHASMPPKDNAVARLSKIVRDLTAHQMKAEINPVVSAMFTKLTPYMTGVYKLLFANRWLFNPVIKKALCLGATSAALVRTTFAPTQLTGSKAPNVLPDRASVVINVRIAPGLDDKTVLAHLRRFTGDADIEVLRYIPPSKLTPTDTPVYDMMERAVASAFPEMLVSPYPVIMATDSRMFYNVTDHVFRFVPFPSVKEDRGTIHSVNERVEVESLKRGIGFYINLIKSTC